MTFLSTCLCQFVVMIRSTHMTKDKIFLKFFASLHEHYEAKCLSRSQSLALDDENGLGL